MVDAGSLRVEGFGISASAFCRPLRSRVKRSADVENPDDLPEILEAQAAMRSKYARSSEQTSMTISPTKAQLREFVEGEVEINFNRNEDFQTALVRDLAKKQHNLEQEQMELQAAIGARPASGSTSLVNESAGMH